MLKVIKRSGNEEAYMREKLQKSLIAIGDEKNMPLNKSDVSMILSKIENILEGKETVSSREIYTILVGVLAVEGFEIYARLFASHPKNAWRRNSIS